MRIETGPKGKGVSVILNKNLSTFQKQRLRRLVAEATEWMSEKFKTLDLAVDMQGTISSRMKDEKGENYFYVLPNWMIQSMFRKMYGEEKPDGLTTSQFSILVRDFLPRVIGLCQKMDISTLAPDSVVIAKDGQANLDINDYMVDTKE